MKKFKFLLVVFSVLALASCKEDLPQEETTVSVLAALENGRVWNSGDEVFINGVRYIVENGGESTVTINDVEKAESYQAVYDCGNGSVEGNVLKLSLPSLQSPSASMAYPMVSLSYVFGLIASIIFFHEHVDMTISKELAISCK